MASVSLKPVCVSATLASCPSQQNRRQAQVLQRSSRLSSSCLTHPLQFSQSQLRKSRCRQAPTLRREHSGTVFAVAGAATPAGPDLLDFGNGQFQPSLDFLQEVEAEGREEFRQTPQLTRYFFWCLARNQWPKLLAAAVAAAVGAVCTLLLPITSGRLFEALAGVRPTPIAPLLQRLAVLYICEPLSTLVYVRCTSSAAEHVMAGVRSRVFRSILTQKVEFFDRHKVGELQALLSEDVQRIKEVLVDNLGKDRGFRALLEGVGVIFWLFALAPQLAPVLASLIITVAGAAAVYSKSVLGVFKQASVAASDLVQTAGESFSAVRTIRSYAGEVLEFQRYDKRVNALYQAQLQIGRLKSQLEAFNRSAVYVSIFALYMLGSRLVKAGQLPVSVLVSFIGYTFTLTFAVQGLITTFSDARRASLAIARINDTTSGLTATGIKRGLKRASLEVQATNKLLAKSVIGEEKRSCVDVGFFCGGINMQNRACQAAIQGDLVFQSVRFTYPLRPSAPALNSYDLTFPNGKVTALVGASGAGKSTVAQLIARFYETQGGRITLSGIDITAFDSAEWAEAVAFVSQEPVLFAMSVADNIAYGAFRGQCTREDVIRAATAANAHEFITKLPQGYDTVVGERGSLLSGGQRQRVAIARALLKDSPILVLDEATSALDSRSERLVQQALDRLVKGRTTVIIAHRLSTVQSADQIVVMDAGKVAEIGSHQELLIRGGAYAALVNSQMVHMLQ
eukprot:jgi/Chlat1/5429/Chrsp35S05317